MNMKYYYIDDTMFLDNELSKQISQRFIRLIKKNKASAVMISSTGKKTRCMQNFIHSIEDATTVVISPAHIHLDGLQGELKSTSLKLDSFPLMRAYSGSCVEYDRDAKTCQRIYLEMFLHYDEVDLESIVDEFEQILSEKINTIKKKKTSIH